MGILRRQWGKVMGCWDGIRQPFYDLRQSRVGKFCDWLFPYLRSTFSSLMGSYSIAMGFMTVLFAINQYFVRTMSAWWRILVLGTGITVFLPSIILQFYARFRHVGKARLLKRYQKTLTAEADAVIRLSDLLSRLNKADIELHKDGDTGLLEDFLKRSKKWLDASKIAYDPKQWDKQLEIDFHTRDEKIIKTFDAIGYALAGFAGGLYTYLFSDDLFNAAHVHNGTAQDEDELFSNIREVGIASIGALFGLAVYIRSMHHEEAQIQLLSGSCSECMRTIGMVLDKSLALLHQIVLRYPSLLGEINLDHVPAIATGPKEIISRQALQKLTSDLHGILKRAPRIDSDDRRDLEMGSLDPATESTGLLRH